MAETVKEQEIKRRMWSVERAVEILNNSTTPDVPQIRRYYVDEVISIANKLIAFINES